MRHRDAWGRPRDLSREGPRRRSDEREDFGQADYSTDYGYDPARRTGYRAAEEVDDGSDYGQADFSDDYGYDPHARRGYRRYEADDDRYGYGRDDREVRARYADEAGHGRRPEHEEGYDRYGRARGEERTWRERGAAWFGGPRRRSSDRVLWAVIAERLDSDRRLDASNIEVIVEGSEVTLNGAVRSRDDKRRAEDLAEVRDVTHVQNNLRVRRRPFGF